MTQIVRVHIVKVLTVDEKKYPSVRLFVNLFISNSDRIDGNLS